MSSCSLQNVEWRCLNSYLSLLQTITKMKKRFCSSYLPLMVLLLFFITITISCSSGQKEFTIQGTVQSTENGKDGYTATLKADDGSDFDAVFSRVKLGDQYRVFTVGERLRVAGDTLHLDNKLRVTVSKINP